MPGKRFFFFCVAGSSGHKLLGSNIHTMLCTMYVYVYIRRKFRSQTSNNMDR